ncbi:uncharacterized protein LOC123381926 [Felis catus]|uniref:uncharacterized protein LOC123381926 n=1 Tax=Felis catus TaxID=9685 RepID=UPI001D19ABFC|nr:uncharacterized protein LOC123381926 [Felis catus]
MALLAYRGGWLRCSSVRTRMRGSGEKRRHPATQSVLPAAVAHRSSVFSSPPLPAFPLSVTRPPAVPLSLVLSQTWLFSPAPCFRRTAAFTRSAPLPEGLTDLWPNEQWSSVGCTQERPLDSVVTSAPRLQPGASPPPKKIARRCGLSVSGTVENRNTHLAPGFAPQPPCPSTRECSRLPGSAGTRWLQQSLPNVLPAVEPLFPVWPENLPVPTLFPGIRPSQQSTARWF